MKGYIMRTGILLAVCGISLLGVLVGIGCSSEPKTEYPIRNTDNKFVTLETSLGNMTVELYHDVAPAHADSFFVRAEEGFYSNMKIFRIMKDFMMQTGDPNNNGTGGPGYNIDAEFSEIPHIRGTLSMARARIPNSAGSQFFICFNTIPNLDNQYTVFGHVVNGYETLAAIENVEVTNSPSGEPSLPVEDVLFIGAYPSDAEGNRISE
jgi:cyclophilin family peptidyl-prolyl cis-trans isomerase